MHGAARSGRHVSPCSSRMTDRTVMRMSGSLTTLRKRIEVLERKRMAPRQPTLLTRADLSILSDEELQQLLAVGERCVGLGGPVIDVRLLSNEDRALLEALEKKFEGPS